MFSVIPMYKIFWFDEDFYVYIHVCIWLANNGNFVLMSDVFTMRWFEVTVYWSKAEFGKFPTFEFMDAL